MEIMLASSRGGTEANMSIRVGFVGLGNIGKPMALRLPAAGLETTVFDIAAAPLQELVAAGAKAAAAPREVAAASDVVGVCVQTDAQVRSVVEGEHGLLVGAKPGLVIAIHSTVLPSTVEAVSAAALARGVAVVDACVTGNIRAPEPNFKLFLGGEPDAIAKLEPYTSAIAVRVIQAGALGNSCKVKICLNLITYLQWTAAFESAALAKATGLPLEVLEEVGRSNGQLTDLMVSFLALHKTPDEARKSEAMQTYLRTNMHVAEKDLAHALALAREAGVALPGTALVSQLMARIYAVDDPKRR
jgi:3-hydroxyisobutyrate dehydrogenase-like beta-hydroxyacid dehydrogenase